MCSSDLFPSHDMSLSYVLTISPPSLLLAASLILLNSSAIFKSSMPSSTSATFPGLFRISSLILLRVSNSCSLSTDPNELLNVLW